MAIEPNAVAEEIREKLENMNARDKWAFGPLLSRAAEALAKPSSPAGGDDTVFDALKAAYLRGAAWVTEIGRYTTADLQKAAYDYADKETSAALSPSTSAAEPVAWLTEWQFKAPDYSVKYPGGGSSITRDATEAAQELANKQRWDRVDWVRQTPLYAHPAPAAVENAQGVRCLATGNPVGTDTWQVGHPCRCANCAPLATEKEGA